MRRQVTTTVVPQLRVAEARRIRQCVNCGAQFSASNSADRGPDIAWHLQCVECHRLVAEQLELTFDRPNGAHIMIYQCRACGTPRSCRPGWRTRCHICLDERSNGPIVTAASNTGVIRLSQYAHVADQIKAILAGTSDDEIRARSIVELNSALTLASVIRQAERPGWSVLATDIHGLPWTGERVKAQSHGTWGRHNLCGTVAKITHGAMDCPACGPAPGSRTHLARQDDPYLLYLVVHRKWQKFGVGDRRRILTHIRGGAHVVQVLKAPFQQVILAELALKKRHRNEIVGQVRHGMIDSFGQATEVMHRRHPIDLIDVLPGGDDITDSFR